MLTRARHLLHLLESEQLGRTEHVELPAQLGLFAAAPNPVVERLKQVDVNALTPVQALSILDELSRTARSS